MMYLSEENNMKVEEEKGNIQVSLNLIASGEPFKWVDAQGVERIDLATNEFFNGKRKIFRPGNGSLFELQLYEEVTPMKGVLSVRKREL